MNKIQKRIQRIKNSEKAKKTHIKFTISKLGAKTIIITKQTHCIIHIKLKRNREKKKVKGKQCCFI